DLETERRGGAVADRASPGPDPAEACGSAGGRVDLERPRSGDIRTDDDEPPAVGCQRRRVGAGDEGPRLAGLGIPREDRAGIGDARLPGDEVRADEAEERALVGAAN